MSDGAPCRCLTSTGYGVGFVPPHFTGGGPLFLLRPPAPPFR